MIAKLVPPLMKMLNMAAGSGAIRKPHLLGVCGLCGLELIVEGANGNGIHSHGEWCCSFTGKKTFTVTEQLHVYSVFSLYVFVRIVASGGHR